VPSLQVEGQKMASMALSRETLASCDIAIIVTNHTSFDYAEIVRNTPLVFDTRNATDGMKAKNLVRL
jgi:UDP-N-acetyl-D-glucosamine dehydrogenase